jgi:hypothetical protein
MRKALILSLALATSAPAGIAGAAQAQSEVRPDTITQIRAGPPWAACRRWDARTGRCLDRSWRSRRWRAWYGRPTCGPGHMWWIDSRGRWRRC